MSGLLYSMKIEPALLQTNSNTRSIQTENNTNWSQYQFDAQTHNIKEEALFK